MAQQMSAILVEYEATVRLGLENGPNHQNRGRTRIRSEDCQTPKVDARREDQLRPEAANPDIIKSSPGVRDTWQRRIPCPLHDLSGSIIPSCSANHAAARTTRRSR